MPIEVWESFYLVCKYLLNIPYLYMYYLYVYESISFF